jgi:hypothetical protein
MQHALTLLERSLYPRRKRNSEVRPIRFRHGYLNDAIQEDAIQEDANRGPRFAREGLRNDFRDRNELSSIWIDIVFSRFWRKSLFKSVTVCTQEKRFIDKR